MPQNSGNDGFGGSWRSYQFTHRFPTNVLLVTTWRQNIGYSISAITQILSSRVSTCLLQGFLVEVVGGDGLFVSWVAQGQEAKAPSSSQTLPGKGRGKHMDTYGRSMAWKHMKTHTPGSQNPQTFPNMAIFSEAMMSNKWIWGAPMFKQTHIKPYKNSDVVRIFALTFGQWTQKYPRVLWILEPSLWKLWVKAGTWDLHLCKLPPQLHHTANQCPNNAVNLHFFKPTCRSIR